MRLEGLSTDIPYSKPTTASSDRWLLAISSLPHPGNNHVDNFSAILLNDASSSDIEFELNTKDIFFSILDSVPSISSAIPFSGMKVSLVSCLGFGVIQA